MDLRDGDAIKVGDVIFIFHDPDTTTRENPVPDVEVDTSAGVVRVNRKAVSFLPRNISSWHISTNAAARSARKMILGGQSGLSTKQAGYLIIRSKTWCAGCAPALNSTPPTRNCSSPSGDWDTN